MKHHCHNTLFLVGKPESVMAAKQALLLEPESTKPVLDFSLLLPPPASLQQAKRNKAFIQELKRWRTAYGAMFGQVLGDMAVAKPDEDAAHE